MKLGIVIYSNDVETVWNAFRYGNFALKDGDQVEIFTTGRGVEAESLGSELFDVKQQMKDFLANGGTIGACGTCLKMRGLEETALLPLAGMKDMHAMIRENDKIISF